MDRSRALSVRRRPTLEPLETRETPAAMGLSSAWADGLRAAAIATDATNPRSTNITRGDDGTLNPPGNLSPDGTSTTFSLRTGPAGSTGAGPGVMIPSVRARFSSTILRAGGTVATSPGSVTGGGVAVGGSGGGSVTTPGVTTPSVVSRFSSTYLRSGFITTPGVVVPPTTIDAATTTSGVSA